MSGKLAAVGVGTPAARAGVARATSCSIFRSMACGQGEGIQLIAQADERGHRLGIRLGAVLDPLERRARGIVAAAQPRADPLLAERA